MLISLVEYAKNHGKDRSNACRMAKAGRFATARKIGRNWVIDSEEPWPEDKRLKSGKYTGWYEKYRKKK